MTRSALGLLIAMGVAMPASAEQAAAACSPKPCEPTQECRSCRSRVTATYGVGGGSPQGPYVSVGLVLGDVRYSGPLVGVGPGRGLLIQGDLARDGGGISVGTPLPFLIKLPRDWEPFGFPLVGLVPKATLLRTWGSPNGAPPDQTYLGAGLELCAVVHFRAGVLWPVGGSAAAKRLWTWGVGVGF